MRHLCDITRNEIFKGNCVKHWQEYPQNVYVELKLPFVYPRKRVLCNDTSYRTCYGEGYEIELLKIIRNKHNKSLAIEDGA